MNSELLTLFPKPSHPHNPGTADQWQAIENRLNTILPPDYKAFINIYGSGLVCNFIKIYNFCDDADVAWFGSTLAMIEVVSEIFPIPLFPNTNGLLLFGETDNGGLHLTWKTKGSSGDWMVSLIDIDSQTIHDLNFGMTEFLIRIRKNLFSSETLNYTPLPKCNEPFISSSDNRLDKVN